MSYSPEQLEKIAHNFDQLAVKSLIVEATKKEKKKLDPKAKVRNRGTVCVPAASAKDKQDHFPINDEGQASNALARVHQYSSAPPWYNGSLKGLQDLVSRKVHSKYPSIGKADKKKKSSVEVLLEKYGQVHPGGPDYDAGQPGTYNPTEQTEADAARFMAAPPTQYQPRQHSGWTGATIDTKMQALLGVNADGRLGPQTQAALDRYKASRNPNMTNQLAFEYLKREPGYATGTPLQYDDNTNTYAKSASSLEDLMKRYG